MSSILKALRKLENDSYNNTRHYSPYNIVRSGRKFRLTEIISRYNLLIVILFFIGLGIFAYFVFVDNKFEIKYKENDKLSVLPKSELSPNLSEKNLTKSKPEFFKTKKESLPDNNPSESMHKIESSLQVDQNTYPDDNQEQEFEPITDPSWLKLQAISWNNIPENRIAVINNVIVHEGTRVKNGFVERIEREYVIIKSDDNKKWILKFGL